MCIAVFIDVPENYVNKIIYTIKNAFFSLDENFIILLGFDNFSNY